jgi:hypothetical protein
LCDAAERERRAIADALAAARAELGAAAIA